MFLRKGAGDPPYRGRSGFRGECIPRHRGNDPFGRDRPVPARARPIIAGTGWRSGSAILQAFLALLALTPIATLFAGPTTAQAEIVGRPLVIDGETIEIGGQRVRLYGIETPASDQVCGTQGWRCGQEAGFALAGIIETHWVYCAERSRNEFEEVVAVCRLSGTNGFDVSAAMVREGWALAFRAQSTDYVALEDEARRAKLGLWRDGVRADWDRRRRHQ